MNPVLPDAAAELGAAARKALEAMGGVDVARRAEVDPAVRATEVAHALDMLGLDDIAPRDGDEALAAAAVLCEELGRVALPYPAAAVLTAREGMPFAVVPEERARVDHGDLFGEWRVAPLHGPVRRATGGGARLATRLGPFVADLDDGGMTSAAASAADASAADVRTDVDLHLTLTAWQVLGTCDRAVELAVEHVTGRVQFGKPLSAFQAVQFQLADAAVAVAGLRELALFTLWRLDTAPAEARADVLALRVHSIDVARTVLRTCQQLHGAAGVCDEYDISMLCRMVQPALRLPFGAERSAAELATAIEGDGFDGLFPHGAGGASASSGAGHTLDAARR